MTDIFGDFRRLVVAALDDLAAQGALPAGAGFRPVAGEPPRDPAPGGLAAQPGVVRAGAQVDALGRSVLLRSGEAWGEPVGTIPDGLYPGAYLIDTGRALAEREGDKWLGQPEAEWLRPVGDFAVAAMMQLIRDDLAAL